MKPLLLLFAGFLLSGFFFSVSSCQKETICKASVTCVDSAGNGVSNAFIELYAPVKSADGKTTYTADVKASGNTDGSGKINFTFKLPAIYDIKASLLSGARTFTGTSVIKLEEGENVEKTVTIR